VSDTAAEQLNRVVQLVAELSRGGEGDAASERVGDLAARFGVTQAQVLGDIRVLTELSDDPSSWLTSLSAYQEGDRVGIVSRGPYRRPVRLTAEELLVLQVALAAEAEAPSDAVYALAALQGQDAANSAQTLAPMPAAPGDEGAVVNLARHAATEGRRVKIAYAGADQGEPSERVVWPHEVIYADGRYYLLSWCESAGDWRRFRADRVLAAELLDDRFDRRSDVPEVGSARDLFDDGGDAVEVVVRFSRVVARWIRERYPDAVEREDGDVVVRFRAVGAGWVIRTVLQYGTEAEVLGPPVVRAAVRRAVG